MEKLQESINNLDLSQLENPSLSEIPKENLPNLEISKTKIDALKNSIKEIDRMISSREKLSKQIHSECESLKSEIDKFLRENERMQIAPSDPTREKNDLRHKKMEIAELQLNEKISCWKDIAQLKKEQREFKRELMQKEERLNMLNKLMEENQNEF